MKRIISILTIALALLAASACKHDDPKSKTPQFVGEWQLSSATVKSVSFGGQTVDVYLSFAEEGTFELYQMIGQGRFRKFSGSWAYEEGLLTGTYKSGKAWGSSYEVSVDGETLTLTASVSGEVDSYKKASIPESVIAEAYEQ